MSKGLINDDPDVLAGEEVNEKYKILHSSPGYIRLLCFTVFTSIKDPIKWHRFSSFLLKMEEMFHNSRTDIFLCLRCKLGSDEVPSNVFDNLDVPRLFKKRVSFLWSI